MSGHGPGAHAGERCHDRSRRNEWAETWDRERAYSNQEAQRAADGAARASSRSGALRSLGVLLVCEVFGSRVVGEQYRDVLIPKSGCEKGGNSLLDLNPIGIEAESCCILSCHIHFS